MSTGRPDLSSAAINAAVVDPLAAASDVRLSGGARRARRPRALLFGGPPLLIIGAAVAAGAAAVGLGVNCLLRREAIAKQYLEVANSQILAERTAMLQNLEAELQKAGSKDATRQFERFREKIRAFEEVLADKLQPGELTHARFLGDRRAGVPGGRSTTCAASCRRRAAKQRSTSATSASGSRRSRRAPKRSEAKERELAGLKEQLRVDTEQRTKIEGLLAQNEEALGRSTLRSRRSPT